MTDERTMRDVQHTHPITGESFQNAYWRGPVVADGGGEKQSPKEVSHPSPRADEEHDLSEEAVADVDHTPPYDDEGANRVWERGDDEDAVADADVAAPDTADDAVSDVDDSENR